MLTYAVVQVLEERVRQCVSEAHELRARNEELEVEVDTLTRQHQALQATLQLLTAQVLRLILLALLVQQYKEQLLAAQV